MFPWIWSITLQCVREHHGKWVNSSFTAAENTIWVTDTQRERGSLSDIPQFPPPCFEGAEGRSRNVHKVHAILSMWSATKKWWNNHRIRVQLWDWKAEETGWKNESLRSSEKQLEELENYRSREVGNEFQPKILSESSNSQNEPNSSISLLPW